MGPMLRSKRIAMGRLCQEERGVTYLLVMLAVVLMGISVTVAAIQWKAVVQREREAELLARGIEIQTALAAYSFQQKKGRVGFSGEIYPLTLDRKSTRLNSSHGYISYAVFCLKKKKNTCSNYHILIVSQAA